MTASQETKKYITPYAFGVSQSLIGKALASPLRRLVSIIIDLIVVASLTLMSVKVLAACVCVVSIIGYFKARKRPEPGYAPKALITSAVFSAIIFLSAHWFSTLDFDWTSDDATQVSLSQDDSSESDSEEPSGALSFVSIMQAVFSDLGLGFGWAALYFSVFTAWFNGQTLGKMLLRIRVVKLDDKTLTLWESFERYGGYSAGLATGLLGFLQVIWDANRQAIHDKISETMVIDLRKPDRPI